jgi:hypothetical protein
MMAPIDLAARRAGRTRDVGTIKEQVIEGAEPLHALVSGWHLTSLQERHLIGAERSLVALQTLLSEPRRHVPATEAAMQHSPQKKNPAGGPGFSVSQALGNGLQNQGHLARGRSIRYWSDWKAYSGRARAIVPTVLHAGGRFAS